ncbi:MAG: hypothetical protein RR205_02410 [Oscillospiraceae bacterium]
MIAIIVYTTMGILMILGLTHILGQISKWLWRPNYLPKTVTIIPLKGEIENLEQLVRFCRANIKWEGNHHSSGEIILLDIGLDAATLESCIRLCNEGKEISFCTEESLQGFLQCKFAV